MAPLYFKLAVIVFAAIGFGVAANIAHHKAKKKPLVCPMNSRCDLVTESVHSRFMGIHNEHLGMAFYALVAVLYAVSIFSPTFLGRATSHVLFELPALGFMFSVYLTLLQAFVIKEWCAWCLASAAVSTTLFFMAILAAPIGFL